MIAVLKLVMGGLAMLAELPVLYWIVHLAVHGRWSEVLSWLGASAWLSLIAHEAFHDEKRRQS